jgi:hypothetical protein
MIGVVDRQRVIAGSATHVLWHINNGYVNSWTSSMKYLQLKDQIQMSKLEKNNETL